jgi:hypothetical protein
MGHLIDLLNKITTAEGGIWDCRYKDKLFITAIKQCKRRQEFVWILLWMKLRALLS